MTHQTIQTRGATPSRISGGGVPARHVPAFTGAMIDAAASPSVSRHLEHSIRYTIDPHPDLGLPKHYPEHVVAEAGRVLAALAPLFRPVTERELRHWLTPLPAAASNVPDADGVHGLVAALMIALTAGVRPLPACCLNERSQATFLAGVTWWPSSGAIYDHLYAEVAPLLRMRKALERIAAFQPNRKAA